MLGLTTCGIKLHAVRRCEDNVGPAVELIFRHSRLSIGAHNRWRFYARRSDHDARDGEPRRHWHPRWQQPRWRWVNNCKNESQKGKINCLLVSDIALFQSPPQCGWRKSSFRKGHLTFSRRYHVFPSVAHNSLNFTRSSVFSLLIIIITRKNCVQPRMSEQESEKKSS